MEVYILDSLLRRDRVIDKFESLIWTERFYEFGDFELIIRSTLENRSLLKAGTKLAMNESYRVMTVETVENGTNSDGKAILKIKGNSLESLLLDRVAKSAFAGQATWDMTLAPAAVMRKMFHDICVTGILKTADIIPYVTEGTFLPAMPPSNITEPVDPIIVKQEPKPLYDAIKAVAEVWNLGFRLLRQDTPVGLFWDVYSGSNRTSGQTTRPPVIFSPELDNLTNTNELTSIESSKNVAYVVALNGASEVYPPEVDVPPTGFERRVLYVDASDITLAYGTAPGGVPDATRVAFEAAVKQRGREELAKYRQLQAFDGEINQHSQYKYQVDYFLGDLVEQRNQDGDINQMRVTEQIFVSDQQGDRTYPTLTLNVFINTGSWLSYFGVKTWSDLDPDPIKWAELP